MAKFNVTLSNWNSQAFWSSIKASTSDDVLDFGDLTDDFAISLNLKTGLLTLSNGSSSFSVGDDGHLGTSDASLGDALALEEFDTFIGSSGHSTLISPDSLADYEISADASGLMVLDGPDGRLTINGFETLILKDDTYLVSLSDKQLELTHSDGSVTRHSIGSSSQTPSADQTNIGIEGITKAETGNTEQPVDAISVWGVDLLNDRLTDQADDHHLVVTEAIAVNPFAIGDVQTAGSLDPNIHRNSGEIGVGNPHLDESLDEGEGDDTFHFNYVDGVGTDSGLDNLSEDLVALSELEMEFENEDPQEQSLDDYWESIASAARENLEFLSSDRSAPSRANALPEVLKKAI